MHLAPANFKTCRTSTFLSNPFPLLSTVLEVGRSDKILGLLRVLGIEQDYHFVLVIGGGIGGCPPLRSWSQGCVQRKSWDEFATPDAPKLDFDSYRYSIRNSSVPGPDLK